MSMAMMVCAHWVRISAGRLNNESLVTGVGGASITVLSSSMSPNIESCLIIDGSMMVRGMQWLETQTKIIMRSSRAAVEDHENINASVSGGQSLVHYRIRP